MRADHPLLRADLAMGLTRAPRPRANSTEQSVAQAPAQEGSQPLFPVKAAVASQALATASIATPSSIPAPTRSAQSAASFATRAEALQEIRSRHDRECPHCTTATAHTQTVFGEGNAEAALMFVGEAPGETEDRLGRPFVGRAGEKLDEMIRAMGLRREDVYIANVLKSRPPENRTPLQHEVDACGPFLIEQILAIRPRVIVTLGGPATKLLLSTDEGITRLRGVWREWTSPAGERIPLMPTYHPAYLLRNYTPQTRAEVWADLQAVMAKLGLSRAG
jgi:DNA polymerase